jgi:hypothetical protein
MDTTSFRLARTCALNKLKFVGTIAEMRNRIRDANVRPLHLGMQIKTENFINVLNNQRVYCNTIYGTICGLDSGIYMKVVRSNHNFHAPKIGDMIKVEFADILPAIIP